MHVYMFTGMCSHMCTQINMDPYKDMHMHLDKSTCMRSYATQIHMYALTCMLSHAYTQIHMHAHIVTRAEGKKSIHLS